MSQPEDCELKSLHDAVGSKTLDLLESLLKTGTDPDTISIKDMTALNFICYQAELSEINLKMIQLLIQYGADVNKQDEDGNSPMMNLFHKESNDMRVRIEALKILLKNGADVTIVNNEGQTIFRYVILCSPTNPDTAVALELLLKNGTDPNTIVGNEFDETALNFICDLPKLTRVHLKMIQILLKYKADVNTQDKDGFTPVMNLFKDAENGKLSLEAFKLLLENGTDVTLVDNQGNTVLNNIFICNIEENAIIFEAVELLFKIGIDVNVKNEYGCTALHIAVNYCRDIRRIGLLLKNGADPNIVDIKLGRTTLNFICYQHKLTRFHLETIQLLIQYGADVNTQDEYGNSPMMNLFHKESNDMRVRIEALKILLKNGADVTIVNNEGQTIFRYVILCNPTNPDTAVALELLLKNGTDPNMIVDNEIDKTALNFICDLSKLTRVHLKMIQILLKYKADVNIRDKIGRSPMINLFRVAKNYKLRFEVFKLLLKNGADVTLVDNEGNTVLNNIFFHNADENPIIVEVIELLLNIGIDANIENNDGQTAFYVAVRHCKSIKAIELLLKNGVDPNTVDINNGWTALHSICSPRKLTRFHLKLIQLLIQYKADVNIRDKDGFNPIMNLFRHAEDYKLRLKVCQLLLENGADVTFADRDDNTVLHGIFLCYPDENPIIFEVVELLVKSAIDVNVRNDIGNSALQLAVGYGRDIRVIELLLKHGVDPNIVDVNYGWTALHYVCHQHKLTRFHLKMIQILLKYKADVNIQNKDGNTPIMNLFSYAKDYKLRLKVCKLLLENGADVTLINNEGATVLHLLFKNDAVKNAMISEAVELLLKSGVDVNIKDNNGKTVLHHAVHCKKTKHVAFLLKNGADVNIKDNDGKTVLHHAVHFSETKHVAFLLKNGADPNITDINGKIPLNYTFEHLDRYFYYMGSTSFLKILKLNIEHSADPCHVGGDGKTVLHSLTEKICLFTPTSDDVDWIAVTRYVPQYVKILLKHGLDVNVKDGDGFTALDKVVSCCNYDIATILVEHGVDANTVQFKGGFSEKGLIESSDLTNFLAIIKLWQSKGFQMNNHQYLTVFKFLTLNQDFETNDDFHSWLFELCNSSYDRLALWICRHICELGSGSLIRKSIEMLIRNDSSTCTNFDSAKIKKTLYTKINLYLYVIEYGNMYLDIETYNYLRNKLNSLVSENPEIEEPLRECSDERLIDIRDQVDLAKKTIISNNISFMDLCTSSPDKTYYLLTKCDLESAIDSVDFYFNRSIGNFIYGYITKALVRRFITQSTTDSIKLLFHGILPDLCCDKIIKFLDVIDLVSVFEAVMNCES